ncbi:MAG TPA: vWA domain-containing protein [Chloroflexota bacterium]|nr:vWA domain-containing protein [Chloroflexota bacterium]
MTTDITTPSETSLDERAADLALETVHWITLLVDRSGSMEDLRAATIDGLNTFIAQHGSDPTTRLRVVEFGTGPDERLELTLLYSNRVYPGVASRALRKLDYRPRGNTPLLAAVLRTINQLEPDVRPRDRALIVIQTDGADNASPDITVDMVRARIEEKQKLGNWTFAYLGAELDAWRVAEDLRIGALNSLSYATSASGVRAAYQLTTDAATRWLGRARTRDLDGGFYPLQLPSPQR